MAITSADVIAAFPELSSVANGTWSWAIDAAYGDLNATEFPNNRDKVALLLAAHYASLGTGSFAHGVVTSETVGPVSRMYANTIKPGDDDLTLTRYGLMARHAIRNTTHRWVVG